MGKTICLGLIAASAWMIFSMPVRAFSTGPVHTGSGETASPPVLLVADTSRRSVPTGVPSVDRDFKEDDTDAVKPKAYVRPQPSPKPGRPALPAPPAASVLPSGVVQPAVAPAAGSFR